MPTPHLTVWYNTRCPVCNGGVDWQRNKLVAAVRAGEIEFRDINQQPDALARFGASLDDVRRRLHATGENGKLIVGADVAIAIWRKTPGEGWLATLFGNRGAAVYAFLLRSLCRSVVCLEQTQRALVSAAGSDFRPLF